jgi:NAD(P)-dependent dehydrogenase (short-subunit alcohol dehydrogenase family)
MNRKTNKRESNPSRLIDRRVIVAGGGSGIGQASAIRIAEEGASVAIVDKRGALAEETTQLIKDAGGKALAVTCDVSSEPEVEAMTSVVIETFGGLDGIFVAAGTAGRGWIHELTLEDWERVLKVNLTGTFLVVKHAIPHLLKAGGGSIVTTGSVASVIVGPGGSAASYAASKGGVLQLTRQIAVDYGNQGIRANCICPGGVRTNIGKHSQEDRADSKTPEGDPLPRSIPTVPILRFAEPSELGSVVVFLLSDDASYVTGSAVMVDGGLTAI